MRSDDDKRKLQARQRALTNRLNRTTSTPSQESGATAATPPPRRREDSATSVLANEQKPRPSRSPFPQAAAPADIPSTTTKPSTPNEPETGTPNSSTAGSDTPRPSSSATEPSESAAVIADPHVEPSRDSEHPPSDQPSEDGDIAAAVSSGSAQPPPTSAPSSSGSTVRAADAHSDSRHERHTESSPPSSATDAQAQAQATAHPAASASSSPEPPTPARRARPAPQSEPSSTSSSAVDAGETALPKDKTARERHRISPPTATLDPSHATTSGPADTSVNRVYDHTAATETADSSGQPTSSPGQHSSATSRSSDKEPPSPGSTARPATHDHPPTGTPTTTARNHRDDREQP
jgi:hypothetical protein